jgi:hypothetical protein
MVIIIRAAIVSLVTAFIAPAVLAQALSASFSIAWDTNQSCVRVVGKISSEFRALGAVQLEQIFPVAVEPQNILSSIGLPPIVGIYTVRSNMIEFQPRYPFEPGVSYRASFTPGKLSSVLRLPQPILSRTTVVSQIYPTAELLPQNLLKFYVHFSAPMSRGNIYQHIHLTNREGQPVELPFLEIDEELWNPEMNRLTLFLDPGRIKRGVRPLEGIGPALEPEKSYTLSIDEAWHDARGVALKESFHKKFRVSFPDRDPPDPASWKISSPKRHTREPLTIDFRKPMDHALALRMISVNSVAGRKSLEQNEKKWLFEPDQPWNLGQYELLVQSTIEDLAGNNIGKPFEVDLEEGHRREPVKTVSLFFKVE